ncbi:MAG TPA: MFS transporter [Micromonosporaceae bacterium]|nr:MFS transporter [Micromonosporaceae bacterium]
MRTVNSPQLARAPFAATVSTMSIIAIVLASQAYATIPLMPHLGKAWGVSEASAAWTTSVFAIAYAGSSLLSGSLADRYGRRVVVAASLAIMAVATLLLPMAGSLTVGCALRAVQGAMAGFFAPVVYTYFSERLDPTRIALALTIVSCSLGGTLVIGQVSGQVLADTLGWAALFWFSAPLLALGAFLAWKVMLADPPRVKSTAAKDSHFWAVPGSAPLIPLFACALAVLGGVTAIYTAVQLYRPAGLGGDADALLALRASALPALIIAVLVTPKLSRIAALPRAGGALAVAGIGLLNAAILADNVAGLAVALFICVLGTSAAGPALIEAVGAGAGSARATAIAIYSFLLNFGAGAGAQLPSVVGGFTQLAALLAVVFAVCIGLTAVSAKLGHARGAPAQTPQGVS